VSVGRVAEGGETDHGENRGYQLWHALGVQNRGKKVVVKEGSDMKSRPNPVGNC